ncbi:MAG: hypothetical protein RLZZ273_1109 [Bacteroidota bacterium]|jgi:hypothetical protein
MKQALLLFCLVAGMVGLSAQPNTSAPTPPVRNAADIISIFGGAYTGIAGVNYNPNWGQSGAVNPAFDPGTGDVVLAYTNFNYQGTAFEGNAQNASEMEYVHIDVWTSNATVLKFTPIDNSGNGPGEVLVDVPLKAGQWSSVDLPKSAFTGMSWKSVIQLKFDGQAGVSPSDIYLDNIYFWKKPAASGEDATLKDLKVDGNTIPGFAPSALTYAYGVPGGGAVPQITLATTNDANATVTKITQATSIPGDATILVTAGNGTTTATYTVSFFFSSPIDAAPEPAPASSTVLSLYSDSYTSVVVDTWRTDWSQSTFEATAIKGNATLKYTNLGFNGIETVKQPIDASAMTTLHMDVWTPNMTVVNVKLVSFLGDGYGGANGDSEANINVNLKAYEWNQVKITLKDFTDAGLKSLADLSQFIFTSTPFGSGIAFVDNIYFSTSTTGVDEVENGMNVYPNPVYSGGTLHFSVPVQQVEIYSVSGQKVLESQEQNVTLSGLPVGSYTVRSVDSQGTVCIRTIIVL